MLVGKDELGEVTATASYTYTKVGFTTITATVTGYSGDIYAYLFDGERFHSYFYRMEKFNDGLFSFQFEGTAQVIFTTTNDWNTAVRLNADEPLLEAGSTTHFELTYPPV